MQRVTTAVIVAAVVLAFAAPASAFNMRQALQAVENLGQWSVMAQRCGDRDSATQIRASIRATIKEARISKSQRERLDGELQYWVRIINRDFRNGGLSVVTACPIWRESGQQEVKKEFARLHRQLG